MSLGESSAESAMRGAQLASDVATTGRAVARRTLPRDWLTACRSWARRQHPLVLYRLLALLIAIGIVSSSLHVDSSLANEWPYLAIAFVHLLLTAVAAPRLATRSDAVHLLAVVADGALCVLLLAATFDWRGPFWLYSMSAVFWPSYRFGLRGALVSVAVFDALVLLTNVESIRETIDDGFGGDLVARLLMVAIVAGAIALTSRALATVRALAAEAERNRIARDLHDGVGKTLGGIAMEAHSLEHWIERDPNEARRRAHYVARIAERGALDVRDVIRGLRRCDERVRLLDSVEELTDAWSRVSGVSVQLRFNGPDLELPVLIHTEVTRMLGELLRNVARHAQANEVRVRVTLSNAGVTLSVRDDGIGFDTTRQNPWSGDGHFGLLGTRERALILGGRFRLQSTPGTGSEVTVDLPLSNREERGGVLARWLSGGP